MSERRVQARIEQGDPYWPAQLAVATAVVLNLGLSEKVTIGPNWVAPLVEGALLAVLVFIVPARATTHLRGRRMFALGVMATVSLVNVISLVLLVHYLLNGGKAGGHRLILSGMVLLGSSVLLFAVWYWELDRGGPAIRFLDAGVLPDFQFPQMENPQLAPRGWRPGFMDYLYLSLTNATAFSPTDAMPLSHGAKAIMAVQSVTSLTTLGLVVARAVNILG